MELQTAGVQRDMLYPVRAEGDYIVSTNPWPRDPEKEERDTTGVQKRKPVYRRQGNRWDQYGESSSAASSEARITSEQVNNESKWGPWLPTEPANRAQPYQLQKSPDELAISDSRSRINGVVVLPDGIRLPAASDLGIKYHQNGRDQSGPFQLEGP